MALQRLINHPPEGKSANVTIVDIPVISNQIPKSWYNLIPNWNLTQDKNTELFVSGIMTLKEVQDDEELFLDYYDVFDLSK